MAEIWGAAIAVGGSLIGGALNKKSGDQAAAKSAEMAQADRDWQEKMYGRTLQDNRADQTNDFGSLRWTTDPKTGKMTQETHLNPAEAARLEDYRQIAADRMSAAKGGYKTDWNALGFGDLANAVHGTKGDTGKYAWQDQKNTSNANDFLRNGQAPPNMAAQMGIGPVGSGPPGSATAGQYPGQGGGGAPPAISYQPGITGGNFSAGDAPSAGGGMLGQKQFDPSMLGGQSPYGPKSDYARNPPEVNAMISGNHVPIAEGYKVGSQFGPPPTPTQPDGPPQRGGGGPTPEQQALADAIRRQQEQDAHAAANAGNGSG